MLAERFAVCRSVLLASSLCVTCCMGHTSRVNGSTSYGGLNNRIERSPRAVRLQMPETGNSTRVRIKIGAILFDPAHKL